jgi:hypothetical protein
VEPGEASVLWLLARETAPESVIRGASAPEPPTKQPFGRASCEAADEAAREALPKRP